MLFSWFLVLVVVPVSCAKEIPVNRNNTNALPMILGTMLLVSLISVTLPSSFYSIIFSQNEIVASILGSIFGSISAGNPITSYILGGEFLAQGVSLVAVTSFIVAWVTVGIIQFPAEAAVLGKKFAFLRNLTSFLFSIIVAILTVAIFGLV